MARRGAAQGSAHATCGARSHRSSTRRNTLAELAGRAAAPSACERHLSALARVAARLERRAPRGPPRGVVRLGPPMGVCALQTTHAGARSSRVAGGGLCRGGRGRRLGGGRLRRHLHAFAQRTHEAQVLESARSPCARAGAGWCWRLSVSRAARGVCGLRSNRCLTSAENGPMSPGAPGAAPPRGART